MGNWYDVVFWSQITPGYATQTSPGVWNEEVLLGMDFVLDQARKRGLKIIWALADNWYPVGGVMQYVEWSESASRHQVSLFESLYGCTGNCTETACFVHRTFSPTKPL